MKRIFLPAFFYFLSNLSFAQSKYFQQRVDYSIDVTLHDSDNTLDGFEIVHYTNNSYDTLRYIWFHLWPNAYKNDRTAFSEQLLQLDRTDFYFSDEKKRGYINRLDFKVDDQTAELEDDSLYRDVAKLILPSPLPPGKTIKISTPFHEKIQYNFSRGGYQDHSYQITQWYPKPAVYDNKGWHPMPYLDQGEFYSEFGNYHVQITVPESYVVAATGQLENQNEIEWLEQIAHRGISQHPVISIKKSDVNGTKKTKKVYRPTIHHSKTAIDPEKVKPVLVKTKTIVFNQKNVHDFAWFADKNFLVRHDTMQLTSGRIIDAWAFFLPSDLAVWKNTIHFIKDAVRTRSRWLGEYPYNTVSVVEAQLGFPGGMEYPTITSISPIEDEESLDKTVEHEVGHNWLYGILASNERDHPWMDEGMNTYFDNRYKKWKYPLTVQPEKDDFLVKRIPVDNEDLVYRTQLAEKKDQPIETTSPAFSETNYDVIAYYKTGLWMKKLEDFIGEKTFDSCLHEYYDRWKFKHPYPEDFKKVVEDVSKKNIDSIFSFLSTKGRLDQQKKKELKVGSFFNFRNTDKYNYLFLSPAAGYNLYDKIMLGGIVHNYTLPEPKFHFFAAPLYATASKTLNGIGRVGYNIMSYGKVRKTEISLSGEKFSIDNFTDSTGRKNYLGFIKIVPAVKLIFRNTNAMSSVKKWLQWKTYFIRETALSFKRDTILQKDIISYPKSNRYLNQLSFTLQNERALYPFSSELVAQQTNDFLRFSFDGRYFFNYPKGGGIRARFFAGKFMYLGATTIYKQFQTDRFHLNMTGANGYEDYTYSNYFIGRNEFQGSVSQQIMIRDGGFKVRSDLLSSKIGKTDKWLTALNLTADLPKDLIPFSSLTTESPIKFFLDIGSYAQGWQKNTATSKFLYDAGVQISLYKNLINIYIPVLYSKVYRDYYKSTIPEKRFWKTISFSIDIQNFRLEKFINLPDL